MIGTERRMTNVKAILLSDHQVRSILSNGQRMIGVGPNMSTVA